MVTQLGRVKLNSAVQQLRICHFIFFPCAFSGRSPKVTVWEFPTQAETLQEQAVVFMQITQLHLATHEFIHSKSCDQSTIAAGLQN